MAIKRELQLRLAAVEVSRPPKWLAILKDGARIWIDPAEGIDLLYAGMLERVDPGADQAGQGGLADLINLLT